MPKKLAIYSLFLVFITLFSSCATMLTGTHQPIKVDVEAGETAYVNGTKVESKDSIIKVRRSIFKKKEVEIVNDQNEVTKKYTKKFNEVSTLNFIVLPFWLVDFITGSVVKYKDQNK